MTITADDRLNSVRDRLAKARKLRSDSTEAIRLARQVQDADAEAVAQAKAQEANIEIEQAQQLESMLLAQRHGVSYRDRGAFDDPDTVALIDRLGRPRGLSEMFRLDRR